MKFGNAHHLFYAPLREKNVYPMKNFFGKFMLARHHRCPIMFSPVKKHPIREKLASVK